MILVVFLGLFTLLLLVGIVLHTTQRKMVYLANLIFSLGLFLARSTVIYYINPLNTPVTRENQGFISFLREMFPWLLGWVAISAILVIAMNIVVPFIHTHFAIERTPPGQPDKVVPKQSLTERRTT